MPELGRTKMYERVQKCIIPSGKIYGRAIVYNTLIFCGHILGAGILMA